MSNYSITGRAILPDADRPVTVEIDPASGSIVSMEGISSGYSDDLLILPGFIDIHVHAREFPRPPDTDEALSDKWRAACRKETFATAGQAAINGGVCLYAAMPNDAVPPSSREAYERKKAAAESSECPVLLFGLIGPDSEPWDHIPYKVYLDHTPSPISFHRWVDVEEVLGRFRGAHVFFHAEDPEVLGNVALKGPRWVTRPPEAEVRAVERVLELTERLGLRTHLCHLSTAGAVQLVMEFNRQSSQRVTCEVTPHHLFFSVDEEVVKWTNPGVDPVSADLLGSNPPLRSEEDRLFLLDALKRGHIDALASDHAPHTLEDKAAGAPGVPHLDTLGPFAAWLISECGFTPHRISEILSVAPARIMAPFLAQPHGAIAVGTSACLTLLDLSGYTIVDGRQIEARGPLRTRCGWSPFQGVRLPATVRSTIIRGKRYDP